MTPLGPAARLDLVREVVVELPELLTKSAAERSREAARVTLSQIWGAPFSLLIDARGVREAHPDALAILAELEEEAGRSRFLVRVARLVKNEELAKLANEEADAEGWGDLSRTFTDDEAARAFLGGADR